MLDTNIVASTFETSASTKTDLSLSDCNLLAGKSQPPYMNHTTVKSHTQKLVSGLGNSLGFLRSCSILPYEKNIIVVLKATN